MLNVLMLNIVNAEWHYVQCLYAQCLNVECCVAESHFAEWNYAECRYADCHGAAAAADATTNLYKGAKVSTPADQSTLATGVLQTALRKCKHSFTLHHDRLWLPLSPLSNFYDEN